MSDASFIHPTACVDEPCQIGPGTRVWHFSHLMAGCTIGAGCNLGQNCFIGADVVIGNNCKLQNNVSLYTGTVLEDDVFLGPSCVLTNVTNPRSQVNRQALYEQTLLRRGCTVGANATVVCGTTRGRYAFVAAGAVVTRDVPDYALMIGVPARRAGWMSRHGQKLPTPDSTGQMICPESGYRYQLSEGAVRCLDLDEEAALPDNKAVGRQSYRDVQGS